MCSFESAEMELPEESVIAVYTDGLIESRETDIDSGLKRLSSALACTATVLHDYCSQVIDTMTTAITPRQDDIALLMARTRARRGGSGRAVRRNRRTAGRPLPVASTGR
jgi:serine phosphatase RsbU (regulator of sigma subunit)